jgi:hypothetical protein
VTGLTDKRLFLALAPAVLLAACGDSPLEEDDGRAATGEVLEGTISDAMLPVDRVRSQAPLAEPEARRTGGAEGEGDDADAEAGEGEPAEGEEGEAGEGQPAPETEE